MQTRDEEDVVTMFVGLFAGRDDCRGSWNGGCIRERVTRTHFVNHLFTQGEGMGVYPAWTDRDKTWTRWGCTDIDKTEDPVDAIKIRDVFDSVGVDSWIERTAHGWHVWVFAGGDVEAKHMRNMFLAAHQIAGVPAKEVNPKQAELAEGQVGNYVRLPYPYNPLPARHERVIVQFPPDFTGGVPWVGYPMTLSDFVRIARKNRIPASRVEELAAAYRPPPPPKQIIAPPSGSLDDAMWKLPTSGRAMFRDGPLPGRDRSSTLARLVHICYESGLPRVDAQELLFDADRRWGKYQARNNEAELFKLLERVYG